MQGRQQAADNRFREQRRLAFAFDAFVGLGRTLDDRVGRFDKNRLVRRHPLLFVFDPGFALARHFAADAPVLPQLEQAVNAGDAHFQHRADTFGGVEPRHAGKDAPAQHPQRQQGNRCARIAEIAHRKIAQLHAQHAARRQRQLCRKRMEAQRFQPAARQHQQDKTGKCDVDGAAVGAAQTVEAAIAPPDKGQQKDHPPPRRQAEDIKQQIGEPGAAAAGRIAQHGMGGGVRPARVAAPVAPE